MTTKGWLAAIALIALFFAAWVIANKPPISEVEALERAEQFVISQGYTDLPPTVDRSNWQQDPVDGSDFERSMRFRRNTLERRPRSILYSPKSGWWVKFRYRNDLDSTRSMWMDHRAQRFRFIYECAAY